MLHLTHHQREMLNGAAGEACAMAMRILVDMARVEGADALVAISSAHIDGCVYHGDTGCYFAEKLVEGGARVRVPTSLNVGGMDLCNPGNVRLQGRSRDLAVRQMNAYLEMGCAPSWTCAPYQAGFRPGLGEQVAWAESNAVVFANSVLGARTNRYGDFLDICCALTGFAPHSGLHVASNRLATLVVDTSAMDGDLKQRDEFYPVLGSWLGRVAGPDIAVIEGLPAAVSENQLKALGAAAASTGSVGLFHVTGVTPEAPTTEAALGGVKPSRTISLTERMLQDQLRSMSTVTGSGLDAVTLGSPHFSFEEFKSLIRLLDGRKVRLPFYVCTGRHAIEALERNELRVGLESCGVTLVVDTCVVVTPVMSDKGGTLMTNSGKFAHYSTSLIGYEVVFASLADCVESAVAGRVVRSPGAWRAG